MADVVGSNPVTADGWLAVVDGLAVLGGLAVVDGVLVVVVLTPAVDAAADAVVEVVAEGVGAA